MLPRRQMQGADFYPWPSSEIAKRGVTAPKTNKTDYKFVQNRVPTSSSKYPDHIHKLKVSVKGTGWKSYNPREPVRSLAPSHQETTHYRDSRSKKFSHIHSPSPEAFEHVWDEGSKRPKTQNEKCRRGTAPKSDFSNIEIFPQKHSQTGAYDVPIIVIRDDKNRKIVSAKRNESSKGARPMTFNPAKSSLVSSLDQEFLDLFER